LFPWIRSNESTLAQDYYFISTSSPENVNSTSGGYCQSHNMKVVFKVMSEESLKKQKQEEVVVDKEVFRINSEVRVRPMTDHVEMASKGEEEKRRDLARKRRRKERRGRQREAVMRMEEEEEVKDVKEMRSEWRREEPLAKPSLTGASASLETLSLFLLLLSLVSLAMLPQN